MAKAFKDTFAVNEALRSSLDFTRSTQCLINRSGRHPVKILKHH